MASGYHVLFLHATPLSQNLSARSLFYRYGSPGWVELVIPTILSVRECIAGRSLCVQWIISHTNANAHIWWEVWESLLSLSHPLLFALVVSVSNLRFFYLFTFIYFYFYFKRSETFWHRHGEWDVQCRLVEEENVICRNFIIIFYFFKETWKDLCGNKRILLCHSSGFEMTSKRNSAKLNLRRSFSEQLRSSTSKAWDLLWKNVRERRLAGQ